MGYIIPLREAWGIIVLTRDRGRILIRWAEARDLGVVLGVVSGIVGVRRKKARVCVCVCARGSIEGICVSLREAGRERYSVSARAVIAEGRVKSEE